MRTISVFHVIHDAGEFVGRVDHDSASDGLVHARHAWGILGVYEPISHDPDSHDLKIVSIRINEYGGIE